jgi:uncharacterized protein (TIGR04255 family)
MPFRYRSAPLVEAVFEFSPEGGTLSEDAAQRIRARFADYTGATDKIRTIVGAFRVDAEAGQVTNVPPPPSAHRVRQWNSDRSRMVQFGADLCAFNALPSYTTFDDYTADMKRLVEAYASEVGSDRTQFLGQRYVNRITIPDDDPGRYFSVYPGGENPGRKPGPFLIQMEVEQIAGGGQAVMTLAYEQALPDRGHVYLLDLYAHVGENSGIPFRWEEASSWQCRAHDAIERAFEFPLTPLCRSLLGREET